MTESLNFAEIIVQRNMGVRGDIVGVTEDDLLEIEKISSLKMPGVYREFLMDCGKKAGIFGETLNIFFPEILELPAEFDEIMAEEGEGDLLPAGAFIFCGLGMWFDFFICDGVRNPRIYRANPELGVIKDMGINFLEYFMLLVETGGRLDDPYHVERFGRSTD